MQDKIDTFLIRGNHQLMQWYIRFLLLCLWTYNAFVSSCQEREGRYLRVLHLLQTSAQTQFHPKKQFACRERTIDKLHPVSHSTRPCIGKSFFFYRFPYNFSQLFSVRDASVVQLASHYILLKTHICWCQWCVQIVKVGSPNTPS